MKRGVILQSRLDSTRLPCKALHDLEGKPLISRCMESLSRIPCHRHVLACDPGSFLAFESLAGREGFRIVTGPKDDVLTRYVQAARQEGVELILRATGDNPLVHPGLSALLADLLEEDGADYALFRDCAVGASVECVTLDALERLVRMDPDAYEREHVCPGIYRRPETFRLLYPEAPGWAGRKPERYSIDTPEDYRFIRSLYRDHPECRPLSLDCLRASGIGTVTEIPNDQ